MMFKLATDTPSPERGAAFGLFARRPGGSGSRAVARVIDGCRRLLSERGEANSQAIAAELMPRLVALDEDALRRFFQHLAQDFGPDPQGVLLAAQRFAEQPDAERLIALTAVSEPPRQELLRRLNRAPGGTAGILRLRRALLDALKSEPGLAAVEADFLHLLSSWFNPGFLQMQPIDWRSSAALLERLIEHEAVHEIQGWGDLRRRLQPDRRCFAFFHPQLPGEPLIFVEVALLPEMPAAIAPLIDPASIPRTAREFRVATFYSISNCEPGLKGVSLGNFLIKRVAEHLQRELPQLHTYCTLSPIPGFAAWLQRADAVAPPRLAAPMAAARELLAQAGGAAALGRSLEPERCPAPLREAIELLATIYLAHESPTARGDAVAKFHLGNGARLERLNWAADLGRKGLRQALGLMVNYLYDLRHVEEQHERFVHGEVSASRRIRRAP
ncbi:malonyl-CoA decarboxylase domain-containing protein [Rivibacter subsaxonicus]|uniref:Malonyl-CoA decarboxylase n=1 Tax=Rivibacter subsaxonicus TaxID=457575 RepID=A0A4Q7VHC0_9BURK|nr:malonyl-CoA decarboxylase family protein [Rivibacter subsaxonicus]RZT95318.1 malonyl-CoA decarboxylase [Rivibacter subsaxonicus]